MLRSLPYSDENSEPERIAANPGLMLSQYPQVDQLRETLRETLPFCCGTVDVPPESYVLYFGKDHLAS